MSTNISIDDVVALMESGTLTGNNIKFNGISLGDNATPNDQTEEYRSDGWSYETSHGCRRHRMVDAMIKKLSRGDKFDRAVAEDAYSWFGFDPTLHPNLAPNDTDELHQLHMAIDSTRVVAHMIASGKDVHWNYRFKANEEFPGENGSYYFTPKQHAIVYGIELPKDDVTNRWPEMWARRLEDMAESRRTSPDITPIRR